MKCPTCGKDEVGPAKLELRRTVAGQAYVATVNGEKCAACGEELIAGPDLEHFGLAIARDAGQHVEPSGSVFRTMRKILGYTSQEAAGLLGVSLETISRWENGARSVDRLAFRLLGMIARDRLEGRTSTEDSLRAAREPAPPGELRIALVRYDVRKSMQAVSPVTVSDVAEPYTRSDPRDDRGHEEEPVVGTQNIVDQLRDEGRQEGRSEEAARAVLTALRVRGIAVADAARERILAQKDPSLLERWLEKAIVAASVGEVLGEPS